MDMYDMYEEAFGTIGLGIGTAAVVYLLLFAFGIACYVMRSVSVYSISKRRGINHAWMAWFPIVDYYQLGCISDQFHYVRDGENRSKRKALLALNIILWVVFIAFFAIFIGMFAEVITAAVDDFMFVDEDALMMSVVGGTVGLVGLYFVLLGLAIALVIVRYVALYDVYASCDPSNKVLFLVFSILFSITEPFFLVACRKKDLGMPPRRGQIPQNGWQQPQQPQWQQSAQPQWQQPVQQPQWQQPVQPQQPAQPTQPAQPPVEPWNNNSEN